MEKKPHIKLNSAKQKDPTITMSFNYGFAKEEANSKKEEPNYLPLIESFRGSLRRFHIDLKTRKEERTDTLTIPAHIDYIKVHFQDQFKIDEFYQSWFNEFGLLGVNFSQFNREVLFAVVDQSKFESFLLDIEYFILKESGIDKNAQYRGKIKFIRDFKLLTTQDIITNEEYDSLINFRLIELPTGSKEATDIYQRLREYLLESTYEFRLNEETNILELYGASQAIIEEIVKNFDIVLSVTSALSTVVHPSEFNTVERDYGFEINNADADLPIIGIIDTGISNITPLASILINDDTFNLTGTSVFIDNANGGFGHGTSVAALSALGIEPYSVNYTGGISADAKLLSIKILDADSGDLSTSKVLNLLRRAKNKYPSIRLFVLTTCYKKNKSSNESFSAYAYELDKFAHDNDCLIFICTANNNSASNQLGYDLNYFKEEETNLCSPADSMNNVVVGAAADNLMNGIFMGISSGREFPALFTRKSHIDLEQYKKPNKRFTKNNPHLFRPDVINSGGDYEQSKLFIGIGSKASIELLSANPAFGFYKDAGTSFSTPLVANIAAQIQKTYPTLRAQTIKALIVNSASLDSIPFDKSIIKLQNKTAGHGIVDPFKSTTSTENSITFVIEDEIRPDEMKVIPLNFPAYLTQDDLGKTRGILSLTATLCFSFDPILNNQLAYCPIQLAFAIFRNQTGNDILKTGNEEKGGINSLLKKSWSQDNRWKLSAPASNTQKIQFPISVKDLEDEGSTFKLAIHCRINPQLLSADKYKKTHHFSTVITIEEKLPESKLTKKLYAEMIAINEIENIIHLEGDVEGDIELLR
jgi:hypothetical protein